MFEERSTFDTFFPITLLEFHKSFLTQIIQGTAYRGMRHLLITGDGMNGRTAFALLVGSVSKIDINGYRTVWKIPVVQKSKFTYYSFPSVGDWVFGSAG